MIRNKREMSRTVRTAGENDMDNVTDMSGHKNKVHQKRKLHALKEGDIFQNNNNHIDDRGLATPARHRGNTNPIDVT